jgi:methylenetetrahydrofolate dehydrogenase (NADP+)/methenyltetrahydrofolate cyclohydrolase
MVGATAQGVNRERVTKALNWQSQSLGYLAAPHAGWSRRLEGSRNRVRESGPSSLRSKKNAMPATRLDGKAIAEQIRTDLSDRITAVKAQLGRPPALAIVLVGDDPASEVYVRNKLKTAEDSGMNVKLETRPGSTSLDDLLALVRQLNADDEFDGILVQSPLPDAMGKDAEQRVFDTIDPSKDVDGFSPISAGFVSQNRTGFAPCTPAGVIEMLDRSGIEIGGKCAVVIGRSDIVGKPMAMLLLHRNATVTICHSRTVDLPAVAREADILVAAVGRAAMVTPDYVKPGATVIDVGMNRVTDPAEAESIFKNVPKRLETFRKNGSILVGDVHPDVAEVAGALTPVPGGVGPLTIAMLMANTVRAAEMRVR